MLQKLSVQYVQIQCTIIHLRHIPYSQWHLWKSGPWQERKREIKTVWGVKQPVCMNLKGKNVFLCLLNIFLLGAPVSLRESKIIALWSESVACLSVLLWTWWEWELLTWCAEKTQGPWPSVILKGSMTEEACMNFSLKTLSSRALSGQVTVCRSPYKIRIVHICLRDFLLPSTTTKNFWGWTEGWKWLAV